MNAFLPWCQTEIVRPDLGSKMTGDGRLRFTVLGSFRVDRDGQEIGIGPRLQRALLAILALDARHVVPVDRLIDLLWRDETGLAAAIASVQAYISHLRRVLEPGLPAHACRVLVTEDPGYLLRVGDDQVDALRFQRWPTRHTRSWRAAGPPLRPLAWPTRWRCGAVIRWPSSPPSRGRCWRWPGWRRCTTLPPKTALRRGWRWAGMLRRRPSWRRWWRRGRCGNSAGGS